MGYGVEEKAILTQREITSSSSLLFQPQTQTQLRASSVP